MSLFKSSLIPIEVKKDINYYVMSICERYPSQLKKSNFDTRMLEHLLDSLVEHGKLEDLIVNEGNEKGNFLIFNIFLF